MKVLGFTGRECLRYFKNLKINFALIDFREHLLAKCKTPQNQCKPKKASYGTSQEPLEMNEVEK
jgi:hypothetical protein